jgi:hypothetical protein
MTGKKGKQHEARADLKAETKLVIDDSRIEIVSAEDLIWRTAESMARISKAEDAPRIAAELVVGLVRDLGLEAARPHAAAICALIVMAQRGDKRQQAINDAKGATMRRGRRAKHALQGKREDDAIGFAIAHLEARGDSRPSNARIKGVMERWGVFLEIGAIKHRRRRHNSGRSDT